MLFPSCALSVLPIGPLVSCHLCDFHQWCPWTSLRAHRFNHPGGSRRVSADQVCCEHLHGFHLAFHQLYLALSTAPKSQFIFLVWGFNPRHIGLLAEPWAQAGARESLQGRRVQAYSCPGFILCPSVAPACRIEWQEGEK